MSSVAAQGGSAVQRLDATGKPWIDYGPPKPAGVPGNALAVKAGHRSPRVYGALARELAEGLMAERPDLASYPEAVAGWATLEAQASLLRRHLDEVGPIVDGPDGPTPRETSLKWLTRLENAARGHREGLGLTPLSEARVARERAEATGAMADLEGLASRGREILLERAAAGVPEPPDRPGEILARVSAEGARVMRLAEARQNGTDVDEGTG